MISASASPLLALSVLRRERQDETSEVLRRVSTMREMSAGSGEAMHS
jgi:hypothetical protein